MPRISNQVEWAPRCLSCVLRINVTCGCRRSLCSRLVRGPDVLARRRVASGLARCEHGPHAQPSRRSDRPSRLVDAVVRGLCHVVHQRCRRPDGRRPRRGDRSHLPKELRADSLQAVAFGRVWPVARSVVAHALGWRGGAGVRWMHSLGEGHSGRPHRLGRAQEAEVGGRRVDPQLEHAVSRLVLQRPRQRNPAQPFGRLEVDALVMRTT